MQTEDKGLDSPLILSLVYSGGAILASKRSPYEDLIASGFDEEILAQRLKRQHRLICAAINAGRLNELKRMSGRSEVEIPEPISSQTQPQEVQQTAQAGYTETPAPADAVVRSPAGDDTAEISREEPARVKTKKRSAPKAAAIVSQSPLGEVQVKETGLVLTIVDENEFRAGEPFTIRVLVEDRSGDEQKPIMGVSISVKILGTAFRPQIYSVRTESNGVASVETTMPNFTSGRAAVLIRAVANGETTEVRRVIHPAK